MGKASKLAKAKKMSSKMKNLRTKSTHRIRTKLRFYRNKTKITKSFPSSMKSIRSEIRKRNNTGLDYSKILLKPVPSDKNMLKMENDNTVTFYVAPTATKAHIKEAFSKIYNTKVRKVNTLNVIGKGKKAYIRLVNDQEALNIASKIGVL